MSSIESATLLTRKANEFLKHGNQISYLFSVRIKENLRFSSVAIGCQNNQSPELPSRLAGFENLSQFAIPAGKVHSYGFHCS